MSVKKVVGNKRNECTFEIFKPCRGKLSKKKFNRVYKRRLNISKREGAETRVQAELGTQVDIGEGAIGGNLDKVVAQGTEWCHEVGMISFKVIKLGDVHQEVPLYVFVLWGPDLFATFIDDHVLVWVVIGNGA